MAEPLTLTAVALWIADKATGGLVSDYFKKKSKKLLGIKDETDKLRQELKDSRDTFDAINAKTAEIIHQRDQAQAEVIRLRVELSSLKAKMAPAASSRKPSPGKS